MTRAAASSMASGSPSRRLQISAIARAFSLVSAKSGLDAAARSTNSFTAAFVASASSDVVLVGSGRGSGSTGTSSSSYRCGAARRLVTRTFSGASICEQFDDERHGAQQVLEAVEQQQRRR